MKRAACLVVALWMAVALAHAESPSLLPDDAGPMAPMAAVGVPAEVPGVGAASAAKPKSEAPGRGLADRLRKAGKGIASWYGSAFQGKRTASGEPFDMHAFTAAHPWLPFGTLVEVTSLVNGRTVIVRINDRGPFKAQRIIDVSRAAAHKLELVGRGTKPVEIRIAQVPATALMPVEDVEPIAR